MRLGPTQATKTDQAQDAPVEDGSVTALGAPDESLISGLVRKIAAEWTRRYVGLLAVIVLVGLVVTITPSRPPLLEQAKSSGGWTSYKASEPESEVMPAPQVALTPVASPSTSALPRRDAVPQSNPPVAPPQKSVEAPPAPIDNTPLGGFVADEPLPDFGSCLSGEQSSTALPIAQLLQVAGPILPLIGPVTPLVLGLLPLLGPFLPKILPVIPMIMPLLDKITPAVSKATPGIVDFENKLLEPLTPYLDKQIPKLLDKERALVSALEPQARRLAGLKESDCAGVTVAAAATKADELVSGDLALVGPSKAVDGVAQRVVTLVLRWSDPTSLRERIAEVAALDGEDVMVRLVLDEAHEGDSTPQTARSWVKETIAALPMVSGWELSLPASGRTSNVDTGARMLLSAIPAALESRRVGQLVGVGLPAAVGDSSVLWGRLHDGLPAEARSRVNFLGISVPGVAMSKDDRKSLIQRVRGAAAGFASDDLPIALNVGTSSEDVRDTARGWAASAVGNSVWLISLDLESELSGSQLDAANKSVALLHRGDK